MSNSTRFLAGICAAIGAVLVLVLAISTTRTDAATPDIASLSVDTDTTGNGSTAATATTFGAIDECRSFATAAGQTFDVDVIVQTIPSPGMASYGVDMLYNPAVLKVTANNDHLMLSNNPASNNAYFAASDSVPDTDGDFADANVDLSTGYDTGAGVLFRLTFQVVGAGDSTLIISQNPQLNGNPQILGKGTNHAGKYTIGAKNDGEVHVATTSCGGGPTNSPSPTPSPTPVTTSPTPSPSPAPSPTPSPTSTGPTPSPSPTPSPTSTGPTPSPTLSPSPTHTATPTPTNTPAATTPAVTHTPTPTATPTPLASVTRSPTPRSGSPTPAALPRTGGVGGSGNTTALLLMLLLGGALIVAASGSVFVVRANRKDDAGNGVK